ncbi:hypothetical protein DB459_13640 [Bradyrhizobium sp. WD16]|nr:hypothetical protein DB459_13640 [Bradyrhizobium sp. WD16]
MRKSSRIRASTSKSSTKKSSASKSSGDRSPARRTPKTSAAKSNSPEFKSSGSRPSGSTPSKSRPFKVGDHVGWNSEAGRISGRIVRVHTRDVVRGGYVHHASADDPNYEIKSDRTDHLALHKARALRHLRRKAQSAS